MKKVFINKIFREFFYHKARYIGLLLFITISIFMVTSILGSANSIIKYEDYYSEILNVEDGEFTVYEELTGKELTNLSHLGFEIESKFYSNYLDDNNNSIIRTYIIRNNINQIHVIDGKKPVKDNEILLEKNYTINHGYNIGDTITFGGLDYIIVGNGVVPDYGLATNQLTDLSADPSSFGLAFVSEEGYKNLRENNENLNMEVLSYSYINHENTSINKLVNTINSDQEKILYILEKEDNPRIGAASQEVQTNMIAGIVAGIIVIFMISYIISLFIINNINIEMETIGTLFSFGYNRKFITIYYVLSPSVLVLFSSILGTYLGFSTIGSKREIDNILKYFSLPNIHVNYSYFLIIFWIIFPVLVVMLVNYTYVKRKLSNNIVSLLRRETKYKIKGKYEYKKIKFIHTFQIRHFVREFKSNMLIAIGVFMSLLILMLGLNCQAIISNLKNDYRSDVNYEHMYILNQPVIYSSTSAEKAVSVNLRKDILGTKKTVNLLGVTENSEYFKFNITDSSEGVVVSSSFSLKFNLKVGDTFSTYDDTTGKKYTFKILDITQYAIGMYIFMDYSRMIEKFEMEDGYYNVLFSNEEIDINSNSVMSTINKRDVIRSGEVYVEQFKGLVTNMIVCSILLFVIILYLLIKFKIEKDKQNVALLKIFGYSKKTIFKMYLRYNFYFISIITLIGIPLSKIIMNYISPILCINFSSGVDTEFKFWMFPSIFLSALVLYIIIEKIILLTLESYTSDLALKNRW